VARSPITMTSLPDMPGTGNMPRTGSGWSGRTLAGTGHRPSHPRVYGRAILIIEQLLTVGGRQVRTCSWPESPAPCWAPDDPTRLTSGPANRC
jgi:hypothetical protein